MRILDVLSQPEVYNLSHRVPMISTLFVSDEPPTVPFFVMAAIVPLPLLLNAIGVAGVQFGYLKVVGRLINDLVAAAFENF